MRRLLAGSLGAAVEDWLGRLERGVDEAAQRGQASRWLRDAGSLAEASPEAAPALHRVRSDIAASLGLDPPSPPANAGAPSPGGESVAPPSREDEPRALVLHLAALPRAVAAPDRAPEQIAPAWSPLLEGALAPEQSLALLAGACLGVTPRAARARALQTLASALAPGRWFPREGFAPGAANLLRTFVADGEGALADYASEVCERLLRHVEVQRERALRPRGGVTPDANRLEQARFTLALLDAAERWQDLRFLNAALKRSDLHHGQWARRRARSRRDLLAGLHWAAAVARQERLLGELAP
jgi:hypothetical protein